MGYPAQMREMPPRPGLQSFQPLIAIICGTALMIFTTDDEKFLALVLIGTDVVIRIFGVPDQAVGGRVARYFERVDVGTIGRLLGMDREAIDDGRVGCRDDGLCANDLPSFGLGDCSPCCLLDRNDRRVRIGLSAPTLKGSRQTGKITQRMEAGLIEKAQTSCRLASNRGIGPPDTFETNPPDRIELPLEFVAAFPIWSVGRRSAAAHRAPRRRSRRSVGVGVRRGWRVRHARGNQQPSARARGSRGVGRDGNQDGDRRCLVDGQRHRRDGPHCPLRDSLRYRQDGRQGRIERDDCRSREISENQSRR